MASRILFELRDADRRKEHDYRFASDSAQMQFASQTVSMNILHEENNVWFIPNEFYIF